MELEFVQPPHQSVAFAALIRTHRPEAVINAAAYTGVDKAEDEEDLAIKINGAAPAAMAGACVDLRVPIVHISTDYVLDGSGDMARAPGARKSPLGAYGRSILAGETGAWRLEVPTSFCVRFGSCRPMVRTS